MKPLGVARQIGQLAPPLQWEPFWGTVQAVNAGPPKTVNVAIRGASGTVTSRYDSNYTPTVGDTVYGFKVSGEGGPDYLVEGKTA